MSSVLLSKWHAKFSERKTVSKISVKSLKIRYILRLGSFHKGLYLVREQCLPNMNKKSVGDLKFCSQSKLWELPHDGISKQVLSVLHQNKFWQKLGEYFSKYANHLGMVKSSLNYLHIQWFLIISQSFSLNE